MGSLPIRECPLGLSLQLRADRLAEVLGGVDPVPIEAELAHPVGEPFHDVEARGAGIPGAPEERVEFTQLPVGPALPPPLLDQRLGQLDRLVTFGEHVREVGHQGALDRGRVALVGTPGAGAHPVVGPLRDRAA